MQIAIEWLKKVNPEDLSNDFIKNTKWSDKSLWKYNYHKALLKVGNYKEILLNIDDAINGFPYIKEFFLNLKAKSFKESEMYEDSAKIYEELIKYKREWWICKDYADLLLRMNLKEKALKMLHLASLLNKSKKIMVKNYHRIGNICLELGREKEALCHFLLSKLIREKEGWSIPEDLESSIEILSNSFPDVYNIDSVSQMFSNCQEFWNEDAIINIKDQKKDKIENKTFSGILNLGHANKPFCFINTSEESIICNKSILPSYLKNNDKVKCVAIPSYDKKKQKDSWRAIKVKKI